ncbi:MAG: universal stress protein [Pseudorhizobium sp.]
MQQIMVATDFSERSDRAIRRATLLARQSGAAMTLVTAVDEDRPPRLVQEEKREAEALLRSMGATIQEMDFVDCKTEVVLAEPSQAIVSTAQRAAPDLLVLGPHRRQLFRDVFIGTTAERTIRKASWPVLMVNAPPAAAYRNVMITTDLSEGSQHAIACFARLKLAPSAYHSILHVFDVPVMRLVMNTAMTEDQRRNYSEEQRAKASASLARHVASTPLSNVTQSVRRDATTVSREILAAAAEGDVDLIVLATHGTSGLHKALLGSVTEEVLRDSPVDVLAIPSAP